MYVLTNESRSFFKRLESCLFVDVKRYILSISWPISWNVVVHAPRISSESLAKFTKIPCRVDLPLPISFVFANLILLLFRSISVLNSSGAFAMTSSIASLNSGSISASETGGLLLVISSYLFLAALLMQRKSYRHQIRLPLSGTSS